MLPQSLRTPSFMIMPLLRRGKKIREGSIELVCEQTPGQRAFTCVVPNKVDKRATKRNRMKRLLREALAIVLSEKTREFTGVIVVRGPIPDTQLEVLTLVRTLFIKAGLIPTL